MGTARSRSAGRHRECLLYRATPAHRRQALGGRVGLEEAVPEPPLVADPAADAHQQETTASAPMCRARTLVLVR